MSATWVLQSYNISMGSTLVLLLVLLVSTSAAWGLSVTMFARGRSSQAKKKKKVALKKTPPKHTNPQNKSPLERCIDTSYEQGQKIIVLVDSNNVRGKTDFEWTNRDLLKLLRAWKRSQQQQLEIVCVVDHGLKAQASPHDDFGLVVFAGPHRTADDMIAVATRWLSTPPEEENNALPNLFVITSDRELKQRCLQNNRPGSLKKKKRQLQRDHVKVFDSPTFVRSLETLRVDLDQDGLESTAWQRIEDQSQILENELRLFDRSRPPWSCQSERQLALEGGPWKTQVLQRPNEGSYNPPPLSRQVFSEQTWHRVLFAEYLRRTVEVLTPEVSAGSAILGEYQHRFQSYVSDDDEVNSLFLDHRIQFAPNQQQALLYYLDQAMDSLIVANNASLSSLSLTEKRAGSGTTMACDSSSAFLRKLVQSSPQLTEQELLSLYLEEAPSHFWFSQLSDLSDLLHRIATRQEEEGWSLRSASYDDEVRPKRHARRNLGRYRRVADEALVEIGQTIESRWFESLKMDS